MNEKKHFDFVSAVVLILVSVGIIVMSLQIHNQSGEVLYLSPGLMPLILGIALLACSIFQLIRSLKDGGFRTRSQEMSAWFKETIKDHTVHSMVIGVVIMAIYTFILMSFLPFWAASLIFIVALMLYLKATSLVRICLLAAGSVGFIVLLFQVLFRVPLP